MTADRFDDLTRRLAQSRSRRGVLKGMAGFALGGVAAAFGKLGASAADRWGDPGGHQRPAPPNWGSGVACPCGVSQAGRPCVSRCSRCEICVGDACFPRCPLACQACDHATGGCQDTCPEGTYCTNLVEGGGCEPLCPSQCAPYDPISKTCKSTCADCEVCKQNTCQSACPDPRQICDNGVCRQCTGPCEYLDNGVCIGCDPECETCNEATGTCETTCSGGRACCLGACIDCCGTCDRSSGLCENTESDVLCVDGRDTCCNGLCKDLSDDQQNCGACGNICRGLDGERCCDGACANLLTDPHNCGACGSPCGAGQQCCDGNCRGGCPAGQTPCDCASDACVDLQSDPTHCGTCGNHCTEGYACCDGVCKPSCSGCTANQTACGDTCCDSDFVCLDDACCPASQVCGATFTPGGQICYDRPSQTEECCTYIGGGYDSTFICAGSEDAPPSSCCVNTVNGQAVEGCCPPGYTCAACGTHLCCPTSGGDCETNCIAPIPPLRT